MFQWIHSKRGQNTAEYAILIGVIVAAAVAMQTYVKRGLQGRVRDAVDFPGEGGDVGISGNSLSFSGQQYEPYYTETDLAISQSGSETQSFTEEGTRTRSYDQTLSRTGEEAVIAPE